MQLKDRQWRSIPADCHHDDVKHYLYGCQETNHSLNWVSKAVAHKKEIHIAFHFIYFIFLGKREEQCIIFSCLFKHMRGANTNIAIQPKCCNNKQRKYQVKIRWRNAKSKPVTIKTFSYYRQFFVKGCHTEFLISVIKTSFFLPHKTRQKIKKMKCSGSWEFSQN